MSPLRAIRYAAWAIVAVAIVAVGGTVAANNNWFRDPAPAPPQVSANAVTVGGPFQLIDHTGAPITEQALQGHPSLMFFGYTYCPDVCPTALAEVTSWLKQLGPEGDKVKVYFVTVDPARDTQKQLQNYLGGFDPRITGMTGPQDKIEAMLKEFRVYWRKVPVEGSNDYLMDHAASFYLLDGTANLVGTLDYDEDKDVALDRIKKLIAES